MVILSDVLDDFINELKQNAHFNDMKIIKAYPYVTKPTRLSKVVLCVSLAEIEGDKCSVGQDYIDSIYKIDVDVFVPFSMGSEKIVDIIKNVISSVDKNTLVSISTNNITSRRDTLCYTARCSLSFNDLINNDRGA